MFRLIHMNWINNTKLQNIIYTLSFTVINNLNKETMNKNTKYVLDLTSCKTSEEILVAIEADLNARKQLGYPKKSWIKRILGL